MPATLTLPLAAQPRVSNAGIFPHRDRDFAVRYCGPTHCLHVYLYACDMRLDGADLAIVEHDLTFTPAGSESRYHLPAAGRHWCIHWQPAPVLGESIELPVHLRLGARGAFVGERVVHIARLHARAGSGGPGPGPGAAVAAAAASSALQELLLRIALEVAMPSAPRERADAAVERVAAIMIERLADPLSVPRLAREVGVSQNHLARRFRLRFGMTIPRFLLSRRIERARQLLVATDQPVGAIAAVVGLADAQHFNKQFRRFVGHSPSAERQR